MSRRFLEEQLRRYAKYRTSIKEELQFIVKELNRATPHKRNSNAKGLDMNFEKFYDSKMEYILRTYLRILKTSQKLSKNSPQRYLKILKYLDLSGDISPDIKKLYRAIVGDEIIRQMKQHIASSISAMEDYINRQQTSSMSSEEKKQQTQRIACFYINIFGANVITP